MSWLTWAGLDVDPDERKALRRAGVAPADVAQLGVDAVVAASNDVVTPDRADVLVRRATLLEVATPQKLVLLERLGVRDGADLAARTPEELFLLAQDISPYTGPVAYDVFAALIHAARGDESARSTSDWWLGERKRTGLDPVRMAWNHRYGRHPDPYPTKQRLRIPAIKVNAWIRVVDIDESGLPVPPLTDGVTVPHTWSGVVVGHWTWAGRHGAFFRLEQAAVGAEVEVVDRRDVRRYEIADVVRGIAPLAVDAPTDGLLLLTPRHLRWPVWFKTWDLPSGADPEQTWVQVAARARPV